MAAVDWTFWANSLAPHNADILGYHIQRCTENCTFITSMPWPWNDTNIGISETLIFDEHEWEPNVEIKYKNGDVGEKKVFGINNFQLLKNTNTFSLEDIIRNNLIPELNFVVCSKMSFSFINIYLTKQPDKC